MADSAPVRQELEFILASAGFRQSENLRRMLRYVVEATLEGRQHQLKERTIGIDVFGRGDAFDPRMDAIVRVQARKLRAKLDEYYQADGSADTLRIELARGSYVPSFVEVALPAPATKRRPSRAIAAVILSIALFVVAILAAIWKFPKQPAEKAGTALPLSIAVLPFINLSGDPQNDYFSEGLSEELLNSLTRVEGLKVVARSSSFQFHSPGVDVRKVGEALQVGTVLEGSVRESAGHLRVTAQLIDASTGFHLWSETYDRSSSDVLKLEDDLARAIVNRLRAKMAGASQLPQSIDPRAYDEYLKARFFLRTPSPDFFLKARSHASEALRIDPHYTAAVGVLATTYAGSAAYGFTYPREDWVKGRDIAQKALDADPTQVESLLVMAGFQAWHEWDYPGAEYRYRKILELTPGDARYRTFYASFLGAMGRQQEARREMKRALELDPLAMQVRYGAAQLHYFLREYAESAALLESSIKADPDYGMFYVLLGRVRTLQGRYAEALETFDQASAKMPGWSVVPGERAYALGQAGRKPEARAILNRLLQEANKGYFPAHRIADAYLAVDEPENALVWIDKAIESRAFRPGWLQVDPRYAHLVTLPQAQPILRKTHLIR